MVNYVLVRDTRRMITYAQLAMRLAQQAVRLFFAFLPNAPLLAGVVGRQYIAWAVLMIENAQEVLEEIKDRPYSKPRAIRRVPIDPLVVFPDDLFRCLFRFRKRHVPALAQWLCLPPRVKSPRTGVVDSASTVLCMLLFRYAFPVRKTVLVASMFATSPSRASELIRTCEDILFARWGRKIAFDQRHCQRAPAIAAELAANLQLPRADVWAFIDGTVRRVCRPGDIIEGSYFSGHKRYHGVKYSCVASADGIIFHVFGPWPARRSDVFMFQQSNVEQQLLNATPPTPNGGVYKVYGDGAYTRGRVITTGFPNVANMPQHQRQYNHKMNGARTSVEWSFGQLIGMWKGIDFHKMNKVAESRLKVEFFNAVLLWNTYNCLYPGMIPAATGVMPPDVHDYLT